MLDCNYPTKLGFFFLKKHFFQKKNQKCRYLSSSAPAAETFEIYMTHSAQRRALARG